MQLVFHEQGKLIKEIEDNLNSLDQRSINHLLNQELFYHARQELPNHIPNQHTPPSDKQLANKLIRQVPQSADLDQTVEQIHHRVEIMLNDNHNQLDALKRQFIAERDRMRQSGVKVKQFKDIYDQEMRSYVPMSTPLSKKMISYFETSTKDWPLQEVVGELLNGLQQPKVQKEEDQYSPKEEQQTRQQLDRLMQQLRLTQNIFNFEQ